MSKHEVRVDESAQHLVSMADMPEDSYGFVVEAPYNTNHVGQIAHREYSGGVALIGSGVWWQNPPRANVVRLLLPGTRIEITLGAKK